MRKRFFCVTNVLLSSMITLLGFGACKPAMKAVVKGDPAITENSDVYRTPPESEQPDIPADVEDNELLDDVAIVYGPEASGGGESLPREPYDEELDMLKVYDVVEQMPQFPGGDKAMTDFFDKNLRWPGDPENNIQGRVIVTFVVERDGLVTNAKVVKSLHPSFDAEALRLVQAMPRWIPGRQHRMAVRVKYTIPITFRLK